MRTALLSALGLTLALVATSASAGATLDRIKAKGELVNVLMESYPPFSLANPTRRDFYSWPTSSASSCAWKPLPGT